MNQQSGKMTAAEIVYIDLRDIYMRLNDQLQHALPFAPDAHIYHLAYEWLPAQFSGAFKGVVPADRLLDFVRDGLRPTINPEGLSDAWEHMLVMGAVQSIVNKHGFTAAPETPSVPAQTFAKS